MARRPQRAKKFLGALIEVPDSLLTDTTVSVKYEYMHHVARRPHRAKNFLEAVMRYFIE